MLLLCPNDQSLNQLVDQIISIGRVSYQDIVLLSGSRQRFYDKKHKVAEILLRRTEVLKEVQYLAETLGYTVFLEYTCERAKIFFE